MFNPKFIIKNFFLVTLAILAFSATASAATITVNIAADNAIANDGFCTLREAINNSNANADTTTGDCVAGSGLDTIEFSMVGATTITVSSDLPTITDPVNIDGETQGASSCTDKTTLEAELTTATQDLSGFTIGAGATASTIKGFVIHGFVNDADTGDGDNTNAGIVNDADNVTIICNVIGLDTSGLASPNSYGIYQTGSSASIGTTTAGFGNVISGNSLDGIVSTGGSNNQISANYIGTNLDGTADLGNGTYGFTAIGGSTNTIAPDNVISGNDSGALRLNSDFQTVQGNIIGLNAAGDSIIANGYGILTNNSNIIIGGDTVDERNIISGNQFGGIDSRGQFTSGVVIQGNYIGTNLAGDTALGNNSYGIRSESISVLVGGSNPGEGNVVSGNDDSGIFLENDSNTIQGNIVGLNAAGTAALPNSGQGLNLTGNVNLVGGNTLAQRNIISGNTAEGIRIAFSTGNSIKGNYIGTSADGSVDFGNGGDGIYSISTGNTVGGEFAGEGNVISGNGGYGVNAAGVVMQGNMIGLNASGDTAIGNDSGGAIVSGIIGGSAFNAQNTISGNTGVGLQVGDDSDVYGNYIGTDGAGLIAIPNTSHGLVASGDNIEIGSILDDEENVISGNQGSGVVLDGTNIDIFGNHIGVNVDQEALGNSIYGVQIIQQSAQVVDVIEGLITVYSATDTVGLGGTTGDHSNIISANGKAGVFVDDSNTNISILGNYIGTDGFGNIVPRDLINDPLGNGENGSAGEDFGGIIAKSSSSIQIGNFAGSGANVIAGNFGPGVLVSQNTNISESIVTILSNRIFGNSDIGIDLANDTNDDGFSELSSGVTANDSSDSDTGANGLLNFIELKAKTDDGGGNYTIDYALDVPSGDYVVQFYENTTADPTNYGEGETLASTVSITHGGTGEENFSSSITATDITNLVATVTQDLGGGNYGTTSEFSSNQIIVAVPSGSGSGGSSNGSSSTRVSTSSPFTGITTTPTGGERECSYEQALKDIEQFQGFDREVSRYEALEYVLLINCIGLDELPEDPADYPFSDINLESERLARVLYTGYNRGIVKGYPDGTYKPANTVNYVELLAINSRAQGLAEDSEESGEQWFSSYINLSLTIQLALNNIDFGDPIKGDVFYLITKTFIES